MRASTALHTLVSVALLATPLHAPIGQSATPPAAPATSLSFSIADVHSLPQSKATHMGVSVVNHDRLLIHHATMLDMISFAYGVESAKLVGGPSWIDSDRFEIAALMPRDTPFKDLRPMLGLLLAERFKLVTHTKDEPQPAYLMTAPQRLLEDEANGRRQC
jgi:uncharacterized protein (TIGR03435 family)